MPRATRRKPAVDGTKLLLFASFLIIIMAFWGPLLWMMSLSIRTRAELSMVPPRMIPSTIAVENYGYIVTETRLPLHMWNSVKITVVTVVGGLLVTVPAAYGFSRFKFKGKAQVLVAILLFQMISTLIIVLPLYRYFLTLGLLDTHVGLILIYITVQIPFTVWLLKGFFDSIPRSLDEAARIDGATRMQTLLRIIVPIAVPGIAAAIVFNTINSWSQFVVPFIFIDKAALYPVSVGVKQFADTAAETTLTTHLLAAGSVLAMLPAIAIFIVLQKFIVGIMIGGAVKG